MKLRRGVDIPPVPLLNWNLIARPRRSITPRMYHAPMQIIRRTRVARRLTRRLRTDFYAVHSVRTLIGKYIIYIYPLDTNLYKKPEREITL